MTPQEEAALRAAGHFLAGHHCPTCGKEWITARSTAVLMHECQPPRRTLDWRTPRQRVDDERGDWARRLFGPAFETALGDRALLDVDEEDER